MNERLKLLRKTLNMSMIEFVKPLGVTHTALSLWENNKRSISDSMLNLICSVYNVNEQWLRTGDGDMFCLPKDEYISSLTNQYHLSQDDVEIISNFLTLDVEDRKHFLSIANKLFVKPQQEEQ